VSKSYPTFFEEFYGMIALPYSRSFTPTPRGKRETVAMNLSDWFTRYRSTRALGHSVARPFFDTDLLIEQQIGEPIPQYIGRLGHAFATLAPGDLPGISPARGSDQLRRWVLTFTRNVEVLKLSGIIILLAADPSSPNVWNAAMSPTSD
jgi:hypothetical protein